MYFEKMLALAILMTHTRLYDHFNPFYVLNSIITVLFFVKSFLEKLINLSKFHWKLKNLSTKINYEL